MGVWIDTDMGFDDIAAILVVAQSEYEIDGISLVFGNAPLPRSVTGLEVSVGAKSLARPITRVFLIGE